MQTVRLIKNTGVSYYDQFVGKEFEVLEIVQSADTGKPAVKLRVPCLGFPGSTSVWEMDEVEVVE